MSAETFECPSCNKTALVSLKNGSVCEDCSHMHADEVEQRREFFKKAEEAGANIQQPKQEDVILRELADRELCRRQLLPLVERFAPDYEAGWVHKDICNRLEAFSDAVRRRESPRQMIFLPPRSGKNITHTEAVRTPKGWTTHGELKVGDQVYHPSGKKLNILAVSEEAPTDWVVEFSNGQTVRCHGNHEWTVFDRAYGEYRTVETNWFVGTTKFGKQRQLHTGPAGKRGGRYMYQLPNIEGPLEAPEQELLIHPYTLGAWLGDGTHSEPVFCFDPRSRTHIDEISTLGTPITKEWPHGGKGYENVRYAYVGNGTLLPKLRELGVYRNKHIPKQYLIGSVEQRKELLAGLIDTDACVDTKGRVMFSTTSKSLRDGFYDLALGLGYRPYHMAEVPPQLSASGIQGKKAIYCVGFQPVEPLNTRLEHKQPKRFVKQRRLAVVDVRYEPDGSKGRCIQVDTPDGLYLVGKTLVPTHNSEIASRNFPAWHLGRNPTHEIIEVSYSASLALDFSRDVRSRLRDPLYTEIFPDCKLDPDTQALEHWMTTAGGGYVAAGVSGPLTGRGMHIGIIDDPVKNADEAESQTVREGQKAWYASTFYTRLAPGGGVLVIMTRWHHDDLAGWLLREQAKGGDKWDVVIYPAIAEQDETYRKKGEPLHPERFDLPMMEKIKGTVGPRVWQALYQQQPTSDDGDYFRRDYFRYYNQEQRPSLESMTCYTAWDLAIGRNEANDFTVGITVGVDERDRIWVLDLVRGKWDGLEICDTILDMHETWHADFVGLEHGQISMSIGPLLNRRVQERQLWDFPFDYQKDGLKTGKRDKQARARAIQGRMRQGMVLFPEEPEWVTGLTKELLAFPAGVHDDQCLVAETEVETPEGSTRICDLRVGDKILTHNGAKQVTAVACTDDSAEIFELRTSAGLLRGTYNHPVYTLNRGWVAMGTLTRFDLLLNITNDNIKDAVCQNQKLSDITGLPIDATLNPLGPATGNITHPLGDQRFTGRSGSTILVRSLTDTKSTTRTAIQQTTSPATWSASARKSTRWNMPRKGRNLAVARNNYSTLIESARLLRSGTALRRDVNGTNRTAKNHGKIENPHPVSVQLAGKRMDRSSLVVRGSVPRGAALGNGSRRISAPAATRRCLHPNRASASSVVSATNLLRTRVARSAQNSAVSVVTAVSNTGIRAPVYNLHVEGANTFFANKVLTHNCDALAWIGQMLAMFSAPVIKDVKAPSWKDKLLKLGAARSSDFLGA